jgi:hypothetical protein
MAACIISRCIGQADQRLKSLPAVRWMIQSLAQMGFFCLMSANAACTRRLKCGRSDAMRFNAIAARAPQRRTDRADISAVRISPSQTGVRPRAPATDSSQPSRRTQAAPTRPSGPTDRSTKSIRRPSSSPGGREVDVRRAQAADTHRQSVAFAPTDHRHDADPRAEAQVGHLSERDRVVDGERHQELSRREPSRGRQPSALCVGRSGGVAVVSVAQLRPGRAALASKDRPPLRDASQQSA